MHVFVVGAKYLRVVLGFLALGFLVVTASSGHKEAFDGSSRDNATAAGLVAIVGSELAATEFCRRWAWDYICFGYRLPPECAAMPMSSLLREM